MTYSVDRAESTASPLTPSLWPPAALASGSTWTSISYMETGTRLSCELSPYEMRLRAFRPMPARAQRRGRMRAFVQWRRM